MDDLDSLLNDLSRGSVVVKSKKARPASSFVDLNELEDLMADLSTPTGGGGGGGGGSNVRVSTLDFGLDDLIAPSKPASSAGAPRVSELDFGLDDLSSPSKPAARSQYGQTPLPPQQQNARVSELDFGLDDLLGPSSGGGGAQKSHSQYGQTPVAPKAQAPRVSTLDFGLDDLETATTGGGGGNQTSQYANVPTKTMGATSGALLADDDDDDDLEALMNNLSAAPQPAAAPVVDLGGGGNSGGGGYGGASMGGSGGGGGGGGGDDLDSLLSNLGDQMGGIDADDPAGRGKCAKCKKEIAGEVLQAMGKHWHPEHWACGNCGKLIGTDDFYDQDGLPHCATCYKASFCPRCAHCNESILDRCVTALGAKWHPEHFICQQCLQGFPDGQFYEHDSKPYCKNCFGSVHAPRCGACDGAIEGDCVNALGNTYHPKCFVCSYCQCSFAGGSFFESGGKPLCETHYHAQTGAVCGGCGKPITGQSVSALGKKYHAANCFVCAFCMNPLAGGNYSEKNGKAYCGECHSRLFKK